MHIRSISLLGLLSVAACSAASVTPIQVGQIVDGQNLGLTSAYIASGCMGAACVTGTAGSSAEKNYDNRLFAAATNSSTSPTTPVPFSGYVQTGTTGSGLSLGGFAMIDDGPGGIGNVSDFWDIGSATNASTTMVIPIGLSNIYDVSTMLSNIWGSAAGFDTVVTFNFGATSNATTFDNVVEVDLLNAGNSTSTASGQIGTAVDCTTNGTGTGANCTTNYAVGALAPNSTPTTKLNTVVQSTGVTVTTSNLASNVFGSTTNNYTSAVAAFLGTTGSLSLYSQTFALASLVTPGANEYLVSVSVKETSGANLGSQTALSAITVDTVPEPSTLLLFITGLGAVGLSRIRRK